MRLLLCADMDRTVIPNGAAPEHPAARVSFRAFCRRPEITLVYVTGRDRQLVVEALAAYRLPPPDYAITDVGTKIYRVTQQDWQPLEEWERQIDQDWNGRSGAEIAHLLGDFTDLQLQEERKQNDHKCSYYLPVKSDPHPLLQRLQKRLAAAGVAAGLIWSIDEVARVGLLDVLPRRADKLHAITFLAGMLGFSAEEVLFAGDSGNDLAVLQSAFKTVLVANAAREIKEEARAAARLRGHEETLYVARGGVLGMNGNYCAGVLEGVCHFFPVLCPGR
jgi:sucrose-6F-phosphate phosphohydrolase